MERLKLLPVLSSRVSELENTNDELREKNRQVEQKLATMQVREGGHTCTHAGSSACTFMSPSSSDFHGMKESNHDSSTASSQTLLSNGRPVRDTRSLHVSESFVRKLLACKPQLPVQLATSRAVERE